MQRHLERPAKFAVFGRQSYNGVRAWAPLSPSVGELSMGILTDFVELLFYRRRPWIIIALLLPSFALIGTWRCDAQLCGQLGGFNFSENFNSLSNMGSNNQLPNNFEFAVNEAGGNLTYSADDGTATAANTYSYGSGNSSDRALGEITSANLQSTIGACFTNNTNHAITSFLINYTGEEWRLAVAGSADRLDFEYSTDATSLTSGTYIPVDALDFHTPNTSGVGKKDGNLGANRTPIGPVVIVPTSPIQPEATFYIHWKPVVIAGANTNDGLAIDDFTIGTTLAPGLAGDYNNNGIVDAADYCIWRDNLNQAVAIPNDITPGTVTQQDWKEWYDRFNHVATNLGAGADAPAVPEPASGALIATAVAVAMFLRTWT
jgi:hypothetical protein